MTDFNPFNNTKDQAFFSSVNKEQISLFGIDLEFWQVSFDQSKDQLYNEDTQPLITQKYPMKGYVDTIIQELFNFNKFGTFHSPDVTEVKISQSTFQDIVGEGQSPKTGDYVYIKYMNRVFQVTSVFTQDVLFLQKEFCYKLVLNSAANIGAVVDPNVDTDTLSDWASAGPDLNDNDFINSSEPSIVIEKIGDTDPFGTWE